MQVNYNVVVSFLKLFVETNVRLRRFKIVDIRKKDWKLFRERLSGWQENYMEGLVKEYANFLNDDKKPASEKFWELENLRHRVRCCSGSDRFRWHRGRQRLRHL